MSQYPYDYGYQYPYQYPSCPRCQAPLGVQGECPQCGYGAAPPSVLPTVLTTLFFGPFGAIAAGLAAGRARRAAQPRGRYWAAFAIALVVPATIAVVAAVLVFGLLARDQLVAIPTQSPAQPTNTQEMTPPPSLPPEPSAPPSQPDPSMPPSQQPEPSTPPSSSPPSVTPTSPTQTPVTVTVSYTCGRDGTGDCFLTERSSPSTTGAALRRWQEGDQLLVVCQMQGSLVRSSVTGISSRIWSRTSTGGYVTNVYLQGVSATGITTPCA